MVAANIMAPCAIPNHKSKQKTFPWHSHLHSLEHGHLWVKFIKGFLNYFLPKLVSFKINKKLARSLTLELLVAI